MRITVVGRHFDVTEPIKKYVDNKLVKFERYTKKIKEAHVILEVQKFRHIAMITLYLKDFKLMATGESRDMYASIDTALGSLHKQVLKLRDRIKEHKGRRRSGKSVRVVRLLQDAQGKASQKEVKRKVVKRDFQPKPMSVDEACMELEVFNDTFLVFRDSDTDAINVVYKRNDGDYGLIVAQ